MSIRARLCQSFGRQALSAAKPRTMPAGARGWKRLLAVVGALGASAVIAAGPGGAKVEVPIGVSLALSGRYASVGTSFQEGVNAAVKDYPYKNFTPKLIFEDNRLDNTLAVQVFSQFVSQKVPVVLGGFAGPSLAVAPIANRSKVVYINPLAPSDSLGGHEYVYNTFPMTAEEMRVAAQALYDSGARKLGVFFAPDIDGKNATDVLANRFQQLGGKVVERQSVDSTAADFASQVAKLNAAGPDAIFGFAAYNVYGAVAKQLREASVTVPLWSYRGFGEPSIFKIAGNAIEGTRYTTPSLSLTGTPEAAAAEKAYSASHDRQPPGTFFTSMYDATWVVLAAIDELTGKKQKVPTGAEVKALLDSKPLMAPFTGVTKFQTSGAQKGTVRKPFDLYEVRGQSFVKVQTLKPSGS